MVGGETETNGDKTAQLWLRLGVKGKVITSVGPEVTSSNLHISCSQNPKNRLPQGTSDCHGPGEHDGALDVGGSTDRGKRRHGLELKLSVCQEEGVWLGTEVFLSDIGRG